jgi:hypothetical protein
VKKVDEVEPAKTAVLKIMEAFTKETMTPEEIKVEQTAEETKAEDKQKIKSLFGPELCNIFLEEFLPMIVPNKDAPMLFKTKKSLLPCLLAVGEHLEYE